MNFETLIPITLFICITYAIKAVMDSRERRQMAESNGSQELVQLIMQSEDARRRHSSLRWGILLLTVALAFLVIEAAGWNQVTPGVIGLLLAAMGIGNLLAYAIARKLSA